MGFGENGCRCDGGVFPVAFHHAKMGCGRVGMEFVAIYQDELWSSLQCVEGAVHGEQRGLQDVYPVNCFGAHFGYCPGKTFFFNDFAQSIALVCRKLFGIIQQRMVKIFGQNNRCREHRACQAATTCFVAASLQKIRLMVGEECHGAKVGNKISNIQQVMSKGNIQYPTRNVQGNIQYPTRNVQCSSGAPAWAHLLPLERFS